MCHERKHRHQTLGHCSWSFICITGYGPFPFCRSTLFSLSPHQCLSLIIFRTQYAFSTSSCCCRNSAKKIPPCLVKFYKNTLVALIDHSWCTYRSRSPLPPPVMVIVSAAAGGPMRLGRRDEQTSGVGGRFLSGLVSEPALR